MTSSSSIARDAAAAASKIIGRKADLRRTLLAARSAIAADARLQYDAAICAQVLTWWDANPVQILGIFWPVRSEPDLRSAYAELAARGVQLALPLVVADDAPLQFAAWAPGDELVLDTFGVSIPARPGKALNPEALLIPCVGFNAERIRLGYGGGYYDRTLAVTPRPFAIGIAYANALATFDAAAHDVALDMIITETSAVPEN